MQAHLPVRAPVPSVEPRAERLRPALERIGIAGCEGVVERADAILSGSFAFLGHSQRIDVPDWRRRYVSHLWNYHLHYFDYARDLAGAAIETGDVRYADRFVQLARSFCHAAQPGRGDGWASYPLSVRIVNWICALTLLCDRIPSEALGELFDSVARQAGWLERRLEKHIQANHLQKNYHALAVAGLLFEGRAAERWRRTGMRGSWNLLSDQVLPDGGHFERSPMYHVLALRDMLELIALCEAAGEPVPAEVRARARAMVNACSVLCREDGRIHLFNDAAEGIAPPRAQLDRLARDVLGARIPVGEGLLTLQDTGYFGVATCDGDRLLIDCGTPGPRHQPAHAHCDLLSFELDVRGHPVVVDSGVHGYAGDPHREYARSTRAHNTVMFGDHEQTEVWSAFRVARMAKARGAAHSIEGDEYRFTGACTPYHNTRIEHHRAVRFDKARLAVVDRVRGDDNLPVRSYLHLHPRFSVDMVDGTAVRLGDSQGNTIRVAWRGVDRIRIGRGSGDPEGWYFPEFGHAEPGPVIVGERMTNDGDEVFGYEIDWG